MPPEARKLLFDMQQAALGISMFVDGRTVIDFKSDLMLRSAVERQFEIIGEAMTRLRKGHPTIFAKVSESDRIISFRNALIHRYDVIDDETTWRIIESKLPILQRELT